MVGSQAEIYPQDPKSGAPYFIPWEHHQIHEGKNFSVPFSVIVGTGTAASVLITPPSTGYIHFTASIESDKGVTWTFSESPNASAGTALAEYNNNRNSVLTSGSVITHTPTYVSAGSILEYHNIGTGGGVVSISGGIANTREEYILNPAKLYLLRAVAGAAATTINFNLNYYIGG